MKTKRSTGLTFEQHSFFFFFFASKTTEVHLLLYHQKPLVFGNAENINAFTETVMVDYTISPILIFSRA